MSKKIAVSFFVSSMAPFLKYYYGINNCNPAKALDPPINSYFPERCSSLVLRVVTRFSFPAIYIADDNSRVRLENFH